MGLLDSSDRLEEFLRAHRRLTHSSADGWFVHAAHVAAEAHDPAALQQVARQDIACRPSKTQRRATLGIGQALLRAASEVAAEGEQQLVRWIGATLGEAAPRATSFGAVACALGSSPSEAAEGFAYAALAGMVAAAVRLRLVGPLAAQAILRRVLVSSPIAPDEDWASFSPLLDVAAMRHELLEPRLFAS
jgi:urease accessory protein